MKISVIIPTYNRAYVLKRAIDSVLAQTYENFELIIVDDGSTDQTHALVKQYRDPRLSFYSIKNSGVSTARNYGVKKSSGEWLAFLDSDDEWLPHKLLKQIEYAQNNPEYPLIHGEEIWVRKGVRVNPKKKHQKSGGDIFLRSLKLCLISPSAVMLKRSLFREMQGFDPTFVVCEDYDLWLKITSRYSIGYIEDPLIIKYGGHEDQLSARYKAMDAWRVKSMMGLLSTGHLSKTSKKALLEEVLTKGQILITGYQKHNNFSDLQNIQNLVSRANNILHHEENSL